MLCNGSNPWRVLMSFSFVCGACLLVLPVVVIASATAAISTLELVSDDEAKPALDTKPSLEATHTEVKPLVPMKDGNTGRLHTFKLAPNGELVAGVTFDRDYLQVYSPELKLVREIPLEFPATAIAIEASGNYVIGGGGKVARISATGEVLVEGPAPHLSGQSAEEAKEKLVAEYKKQMEEVREVYSQQTERIKEQIERLEKKKEEKGDDFAKRDQTRLESLSQQLEQYETIIEQQFSIEIDDDTLRYMLDSQTRIPSLTVSGDDVFVAVSTGRGYAIWRVDSNLENGTKVIENLSGCCGQFDFYAMNDKLFLAENTKFQVGIYDRDGKHLNGFGSRAGADEAGFGSCCNPMNVICTSEGDILTAESSIGKIKRFNQAGELVSVVGKARIGGGCKHVALGFDESRNRYYIQYQDKNKICILLPNEEAEAVMGEINAQRKEAAAQLTKLDGRWERVKAEEKAAEDDESQAAASGSTVVTASGEFSMEDYMAMQTDFSTLTFNSAGQSLRGEFAAANDQGGGILAQLFGGGENAQRPPVKYTTVPQSFADGQLKMDLEDESGLISHELLAKVSGDTLTVTFLSEYSNSAKPLVFQRPAVNTSTESGE